MVDRGLTVLRLVRAVGLALHGGGGTGEGVEGGGMNARLPALAAVVVAAPPLGSSSGGAATTNTDVHILTAAAFTLVAAVPTLGVALDELRSAGCGGGGCASARSLRVRRQDAPGAGHGGRRGLPRLRPDRY